MQRQEWHQQLLYHNRSRQGEVPDLHQRQSCGQRRMARGMRAVSMIRVLFMILDDVMWFWSEKLSERCDWNREFLSNRYLRNFRLPSVVLQRMLFDFYIRIHKQIACQKSV